MQIKKMIRNKAINLWRFSAVHSSFYKHHKSVKNNPNFKRESLTDDEKKIYRNYWKVISPIISFKTVKALLFLKTKVLIVNGLIKMSFQRTSFINLMIFTIPTILLS